MKPEERAALLTQVYASELDYAEVDQRAALLRDMKQPTKAQLDELADYEKKLAHDRNLLAKWIRALKEDGWDVFDDRVAWRELGDRTCLAHRRVVLDKLKQESVERGAAVTTERAEADKVKATEEIKQWVASLGDAALPLDELNVRCATAQKAHAEALASAKVEREGHGMRTDMLDALLRGAVTYRYGPDLSPGGSTWIGEALLQDAPSIAGYRETAPYALDLDCIRQSDVAGHVAWRFLNRSKMIPVYVELEGDLCLERYDLGDSFLYTHFRGLGPQGYQQAPLWVVGHTFLPTVRRIRLECLDATNVLGGGGVLPG